MGQRPPREPGLRLRCLWACVRACRSGRLKRYANRPDLNRRMPGFSISMGFGLHVGWAIEGAIGGPSALGVNWWFWSGPLLG